MAKPTVERYGDAFVVTWPEQGWGFGLERVIEDRDGMLRALLTVDGVTPEARGLVFGPVKVELQSADAQLRMARTLATRVNGMGPEQWLTLVASACTIVVREWFKPLPVHDLSTYAEGDAVSYVIEGLIPENDTTLLYGDGESAKSMIALMIAATRATGLNVPWGPKLEPGPVLYLDWETTHRTVATRLRRIAQGMGISTPTVYYRQCLRTLADDLPEIRKEISEKKISMVIVDSVGFAVSGPLTEDLTARAVMRALRELEVTRLVVAHVSADAARNKTLKARPFGSSFFWNGMRSGIEVRRSDDSNQGADVVHVGMYHTKTNDGRHHKPIGLRLAFDGLNGPIAFDAADLHDVADLAGRMPLSDRIRAALKHGSMNTSELAEALDVKEDRLRPTLNKMAGVVRLEAGGGKGKPSTWGLSQ